MHLISKEKQRSSFSISARLFKSEKKEKYKKKLHARIHRFILYLRQGSLYYRFFSLYAHKKIIIATNICRRFSSNKSRHIHVHTHAHKTKQVFYTNHTPEKKTTLCLNLTRPTKNKLGSKLTYTNI